MNSCTPKKIPLKLPELHDLIKLCSTQGVEVIKLPGLYVKFGQSKAIESPPAQAIAGTAIEETQDSRDSEAQLAKDELDLKQDQLDLMLIENPSEAERLIAEGELVDGPCGTAEAV